MKLDVPFYKQTTPLNCGPRALKMIFSYFGKDIPDNIIEEAVGIKDGKGVTTIQLAIATVDLGFKSSIYTKVISFNEENLKLDYYKKYLDSNAEQFAYLVKKARDIGVKLYEKILTLEELLSKISKKNLAIVLIDWDIVRSNKKEKYLGHFVPLVGYDDEFVYVHNHGLNGTRSFLPIKREIFDKARKAEGTDEDILFISK